MVMAMVMAMMDRQHGEADVKKGRVYSTWRAQLASLVTGCSNKLN